MQRSLNQDKALKFVVFTCYIQCGMGQICIIY